VHNTAPGPVAARPPLPGGGHGLVGLRERAHLLGGDFHAAPSPDGGFMVKAVFPVGWTGTRQSADVSGT
ncbi:two-component sensor histidine kinase, partial [Streptomyces cahuitamycinicus]